MGIFIDNPISSVQLRLRGGWKGLLITCGVYAFIIFGAMGLWAELDNGHLKNAARGWTVCLMLIQVFLVLFFSVVRVSAAVRQDNATGIMESHRLMPISGFVASVGFLIGPSIQMLAIGFVTFVAGIVSTDVAGYDESRWLVYNVVLLVFTLFVCACGVLLGFYRRALFGTIVGIIVVGLFSQGMLLFAVPAMAVLASPLAGSTIFSISGALDLSQTGFPIAFAAQAIIGALMLAAASRKFRQPERPAFSVSLSMMLLLAWVVINLVGTLQWPLFEPIFLHYRVNNRVDERLQTQFAGATFSAIFLSLLPISAAVRAGRERDDAQPHAKRSPPAGRVITILLCAVLVMFLLLIPEGATPIKDRPLLGMIALSMLAAVANFGALLSAYRSTPRKTGMLVVLFVFITWLGPLFADVIVHTVFTPEIESNGLPWTLTGYGPIGSIASAWNPEMQSIGGIACQVAIAMVMIAVAILVEKRRNRATAALQFAEPSPKLTPDA